MKIDLRNFSHEGRNLEVRAVLAQDAWRVRVYEGDRPVTGVVYSVSYETQVGASLQSVPGDLVDELMNIAQSDVEQGRVQLI